ncbi:uncharacterized protein TNCV_4085111 [Trichonephila clavipes]|nr:uncharacterized protein TNCV_4085111 [Trichonephila clavipes]
MGFYSLPESEFRFLNEEEIDKFDLMSENSDSNTGYILEVDLFYPPELHSKHNSFPTAPQHESIMQAPGGALSIKADRVVQTTISRLASGHIRGLSFNLGQKIYENCTKCNLVQATPDHLLFCAGLEREDIYSSPLLVSPPDDATAYRLLHSSINCQVANYRQHFAMIPLNRRYNLRNSVACEYYNF